jgi:peptide/nickel transport system permease protein
VTGELTVTAMLLSIVIALPLGIVAAVRPYTVTDSAVRVAGLIGLSLPNFWLATMLILFISLYWRVLPTSGYVPLNRDLIGSLRSIILPAISLALPNVAILMRMTRSSMLEVLRQDYVVTARSKGLRNRVVIARHALRNALIPVVTVAGIQVGYLLGGAIIIEQIFALPGIGTLILGAITQRDYPLLQAGSLVVAFAFPVVNILVDVLYAYIDPTIRYG